MQKPSLVPLLIFVAWIHTLFNIKFFTLQPEFFLLFFIMSIKKFWLAMPTITCHLKVS